MRFIDEVDILIGSGDGGDGHVSFRREKYIPFGGPDGGNGGNGGNIIFEATDQLNTLVHFKGKRRFIASAGQSGMKQQRDGKNAEDMVLEVPVGTQIKDAETGELIKDLVEDGEKFTALKGGRGGLGNMYFKTSVNQTPRHSTPGEKGVEHNIKLELKLLANIALIGLPNAGKSTLIAALSAAKPKIADYPFTTLLPNLGVVKISDEKSLVLADIPGLIEDAHQGKGLGIKFLKHIERTQALVHLIDISWCLDEFEAYESYITIRQELEKYNPELANKKEIICLTKIDALTDDNIQKFQKFFEENLDKKVVPLSSVGHVNIDLLKQLMWKVQEASQ